MEVALQVSSALDLTEMQKREDPPLSSSFSCVNCSLPPLKGLTLRAMVVATFKFRGVNLAPTGFPSYVFYKESAQTFTSLHVHGLAAAFLVGSFG